MGSLEVCESGMSEEKASAVISSLRSGMTFFPTLNTSEEDAADLRTLCLTARHLLSDLGWPYRVSTNDLISWLPQFHDEILRASMVVDAPSGAARVDVAFADTLLLLRAACCQAGSAGHSATATAVLESLVKGRWPGLSSDNVED